jgi:hypothetical protein
VRSIVAPLHLVNLAAYTQGVAPYSSPAVVVPTAMAIPVLSDNRVDFNSAPSAPPAATWKSNDQL